MTPHDRAVALRAALALIATYPYGVDAEELRRVARVALANDDPGDES